MAKMRLYKFYTMFNYLILLELQVEKNLKGGMVPKHLCSN